MSEDLEPTEKVENPCQIFYLQSSSGKVYRCYLKSEADAVIAELKAQKAQAEDDCAYWKMREGNAVNAMHETEEACMCLTKSERYQKYKRCLAMAEWCESENYTACWYHENSERCKWTEKWHERWLKIAEQFKEAK